jgi:Zn-dependent protease
MDELTAELDSVSRIVGKYFPIYETRVSPNVYTFFVRVDETTMEERFDQMRMEMTPQMFIPIFTSENGEQVIHVQKRPQVRYRSVYVNLIFLLATIGTTIFAGMMHWAGYQGLDLYSFESLAYGTLYFAFPLLAILATHEFGHYFMARRHNVAASLPFFIPSFPPLGTFGAVISMRDPIPNRKALLDIGFAGPIFGLMVAIPVTAIGLYLTSIGAKPVPTDLGQGGGLAFFPPLLFQFLEMMIPIPQNVLSHPTAFAGWVGLFVTALNLIPAGQLDGGHIARALLGKNATYVSYASLMILFFLGMLYFGWMIIALLILLLGATHPPPLNDVTKLDVRRKIVGSTAAIMLVLCFVIVPVAQIPTDYDFEFRDFDNPADELAEFNITAIPGSNNSFEFLVNNTGNVGTEIGLELDISWSMLNANWTGYLFFESEGELMIAGEEKGFLFLNSSSEQNVTMVVDVPNVPPGIYTMRVLGTIETSVIEIENELVVNITVQ